MTCRKKKPQWSNKWSLMGKRGRSERKRHLPIWRNTPFPKKEKSFLFFCRQVSQHHGIKRNILELDTGAESTIGHTATVFSPLFGLRHFSLKKKNKKRSDKTPVVSPPSALRSSVMCNNNNPDKCDGLLKRKSPWRAFMYFFKKNPWLFCGTWCEGEKK